MSDARILEQGYRRYDGPRLGPGRAVRSLARHSAERALGLRRSPWAKVLPFLAIAIAYVPAVVFVGVAALLPEQVVRDTGLLPGPADYYRFVTAAIVIFVALVGPEVLCPDRRNRMLGTYLASPLTRDTYLVAKVLAVLPVLALVTLGPPLLLLVGLTLAEAGPEGPVELLTALGRVLAGGVAVSAAYTAVSLAVSSLTDRRALASAGVILVLLVSSVVTEVAATGNGQTLMLLDVSSLPVELVQRIYGQPGAAPAVSTAAVVGANVAWTVAAGVFLRQRYRSLQVVR
jgi:ABC-2 type transport system permease protein